MGALSEFFRRQVLILVHERTEELNLKKKDGEPFTLRTQVGYMVSVDDLGEEEKLRIRLPLREGQAPYPPGYAVISGRSFDRDDRGNIELKPYGFQIVPIPRGVWAMIEADEKRPAVAA